MSQKLKKRKFNLCEDILRIIVCDLTVKELLRLERVSDQFRQCVNYALKKKTGIRLGAKVKNLICFDPKHSIVGTNIRRSVEFQYNKYDVTYDLIKSRQSFEDILWKCSNIKSLYLSECRLNLNTIELIVTRSPQLKCLSLVRIYCTSDLEEWKVMAGSLSSLDLRHLAIGGDCYRERTRHNCSVIQDFSAQIDYLVKQLSSLEKLTLLYYDKPLTNLFKCLPKSIQSLQLIRCQKIDVNSLSVLHNCLFPNLNQLKIDLNFYGNRHELEIFQTITSNLCLKKLVFHCDSLDTSEDESWNQFEKSHEVETFELKIYHNSLLRLGFTVYPMMSLRSLSLHNFNAKPQMFKHFAESFPNLRQLSLKTYEIVCVCTDDASDGESYMIFGYYRHDCYVCCPKSMKYLSRIPQLKRLRLFNVEREALDAFYHFKELAVLDLHIFGRDSRFVQSLLNSCAFISKNRVSKSPFSLITSKSLIEELLKEMNNTLNSIPDNIRLFIRPYPTKRF